MSKATISHLGSFRLLKMIHAGQATQLWQGYDDHQKRFVALKTVAEKPKPTREQVQLLKWEYSVGSKIDHPRIIRIFDYGVDRGTPYLAMEWFPGGTMKNRMRQASAELAALVPKIALQAAEGLAHFGGLGWVHRDVKPENFLISDAGDVKLIDFALARRSKGFFAKLLAPKAKIQGTRSYMSPEQIRGEALDERADVYSLACTLFELVGGRPPFTGVTAAELLAKHLNAPPPTVESLNPNATTEFSQLLRRSMAKDPNSRPTSCQEFYLALRAMQVLKRAAPSG